jgi:putative NADPH-quinone reductase
VVRGRRRERSSANVLVVYAHPVETSYCAALRDRVVASLHRAGHAVDLLDLYAEGFDPHLDADEWSPATPGATERPDLWPHVERLRSAAHLVFVYPTWFGAPPAMLKGWLDRVWVAGVAFDRVAGSNRPRARLLHIRRLTVVTTYGSSRWVNAVEGEPGKRLVKRWLRVLCHPLARSRWIALYGMDRVDDNGRRAFLDRVERAFT